MIVWIFSISTVAIIHFLLIALDDGVIELQREAHERRQRDK